MKLAIRKAKQSKAEKRGDGPPPRVGAVIVADGELIAAASRGSRGSGAHAEFCCLDSISEQVDLTGATVYTTLEPCTYRSPNKIPCAERLIKAGVSTVYIGSYDPNPRVYRQGWRRLRDAGISLHDFPSDLRTRIHKLNIEFLGNYSHRQRDSGEVTFDYRLNGGRFEIHSEIAGKFVTTWSQSGSDSIHIRDPKNHVATALYAECVTEVDDPSAFSFSEEVVSLTRGSVGIFRNRSGNHLVVRVKDVARGRSYESDDDSWFVSFDYEVRVAR